MRFWRSAPQNLTRAKVNKHMHFLTYVDRKGKLRPGCRLQDQIIDIPNALRCFQAAAKQEINLVVGFISLKNIFTLTLQEKHFLEEAINFIAENPSAKSYGESILLNLEDLTLAPPIPNPGKVICVAMNYPGDSTMAKPDYPVIFLKPVSTLCGSKSPINLPPASQQVQFEGELAFYIKSKCRNIDRSEAPQVIGGYTIANDLGDSVLEKRTSQWTSGKMFDTFTPTGPFLVTPDEIPNPHALEIKTHLNQKLVQEAKTEEMLFKIDEIIATLSSLTTLYPGDMILTGSPKLFKGKPVPKNALKAGDQIEVSISGLGTLVNDVRKGN